MCEPVSAFMALSLAGSAISAAGQMAQGEQAAAMGGLQQQVYDAQARNEQSASSFEQAKVRRKAELAAANARAQVGASGVAFDGSPVEAFAANAAENELDVQAIQFGSTLKQDQLRTQGKLAKFSGDTSRTAGYIAGASTLVSGAANVFRPSVKMGQSVFA